MAKTINIPLDAPIPAHGGVVNAVILREPSFDEFMTLGDPVVWSKAPDGSVFAVENASTIKAYLAACLVEPKDPLLLEAGGLKLARAVKDAILGFFHTAPSEGELSKTSQMSSSSSVDSTPVS